MVWAVLHPKEKSQFYSRSCLGTSLSSRPIRRPTTHSDLGSIRVFCLRLEKRGRSRFVVGEYNRVKQEQLHQEAPEKIVVIRKGLERGHPALELSWKP